MGAIWKVVTAVLAGFLMISLVQWIAFHGAEGRVKSLPCDTRLAPYRLEVESFLPPSELLKNATGYRLGYNGEVEAVVPRKMGFLSDDTGIWSEKRSGN